MQRRGINLQLASSLDDFELLKTVDYATVTHLNCNSQCNRDYYKENFPQDSDKNPQHVLVIYQGDKYAVINQAARDMLVPAAKNFSADQQAFVLQPEERDEQDILEKKDRYSDMNDLGRYLQYARILNKFLLDAPRTQKPIICYRHVTDLQIAIFKGTKLVNPPKRHRMLAQDPYEVPIYTRKPVSYFKNVLQVGETVSMHGFLSCSLSPSFPIIFGKKAYEEARDPIFIQFNLPAGYPGYYLGKGEYEFLIPCLLDDGSLPKFVVTGVKNVLHRVRKGEPSLNCDFKDLACVKTEIAKDGTEISTFPLRVVQLTALETNFTQKNPIECTKCRTVN